MDMDVFQVIAVVSARVHAVAVGAILLTCLFVNAYSEGVADHELPRIVQEQIDAIVPALTMHKIEFAKMANAENDKLIKALYEMMEKEVRDGRMESAILLKEALKQARDGSLIEKYINPTMSDLLGEYFERNCKTIVCDPLKMDSWDSSLTIIPSFRMEKDILRFHSGGGIEIRLPTSGKMFVSIIGDIVPVDIGKMLFGESVVFHQHWSSIQTVDSRPVRKISISVNMTTGRYSIFLNDSPFANNMAMPVVAPKTLKIVDEGSPAYGSMIKSIVVKSMAPKAEEEPSRF